MSWDQDYVTPSYLELLERFAQKNAETLLEEECEKQGIKIVSKEKILLTEGMYDDIYGFKITLSDGRVFVPKLYKKVTSNGNYGCDYYDYFLEDYDVNVTYENHDDSDTEEPLIGGCGDEGCGCGF